MNGNQKNYKKAIMLAILILPIFFLNKEVRANDIDQSALIDDSIAGQTADDQSTVDHGVLSDIVVPIDKIINARQITTKKGNIQIYSYISDNIIPTDLITYENKPLQENLKLRRPNAKFYPISATTTLAKFYSRDLYYDDQGLWKEILVATTSTDNFRNAMIAPVSLIDKIKNIIIGRADADTITPKAMQDAGIYNQATTQAGSRTAPGYANGYEGAWITEMHGNGSAWQCERTVMTFDTSAIGAYSTVNSASLFVRGQPGGSDAGSSAAPVASSDYGSVSPLAFNNISMTPNSDNIFTKASWSTTGFNEFILNATGIAAINKTGSSFYGAVDYYYDFLNNLPPARNKSFLRFLSIFLFPLYFLLMSPAE